MTLWRFELNWDYHELGGFIVEARSPKQAAQRLNDWLATGEWKDGSKHHYIPGAYDKKPWPQPFEADDATDVGIVYITGGCDD